MSNTMTTAQKSKLYRQRNPERWKKTITEYHKRKFTCECGAVICNKVRPQHLKTRKHIERMELLMRKPPVPEEDDTESE